MVEDSALLRTPQTSVSVGRTPNPRPAPSLTTAYTPDNRQVVESGNDDTKSNGKLLNESLQTEDLSAAGDQSQTSTSSDLPAINSTNLNTNTLGQQNYHNRISEDHSDDNMSSSDGVVLRHTNSNDVQSTAVFRNSMIVESSNTHIPVENMLHRSRGYTDSGNTRSCTTPTLHSHFIPNENGITMSPYVTNLNDSFSSANAVNLESTNCPTLTPHMNLSNLQKSISDTKLDSPTEKDVSSDGMASSGAMTSSKDRHSQNKSLKKESLRQQKKFYRQEKKKAAQEIMLALNDPSVEMMANFLKVRTTLKSWVKLYCVLKPGLLVLYRSQKTNKSSQWVGTVLLNCCNLIERPSKKDGFCFKIFHPLEQSIWALKGPHGESTSLMGLNLPSCYLIFRALSDSDGKCWMDHMELTIKVGPAKIKGSLTDTPGGDSLDARGDDDPEDDYEPDPEIIETIHFADDAESGHDQYQDDPLEEDTDNDDGGSSNRNHLNSSSTMDPADVHFNCTLSSGLEDEVEETKYVLAPPEVMGDIEGSGVQEESVHGENKSLILTLVKQVKPGMDLSKVVLPTFILEPRSFLDKLSDYYYHCDMVTSAINQDDPFERMKSVVVFYLSGFYKKPKGLKKPYNPILGEYFRCYWQHPSGTKTFYIAEQVSHHPPISTFHVTNRSEGFAISGTILAKSKFYGTSVSAFFDGNAKLSLLSKGEDYEMTFPYAFCKGILFGTLSMELGGKVHISCEKTGYQTDIEFKLKPYLFGGKDCNAIMGQITLGGKVLATIDGKWDSEIFLTDHRSKSPQRSKIWEVTKEVTRKRLPRYLVNYADQDEFESEKLWKKVDKAILTGDQILATEEKYVLEERQRNEAKERSRSGTQWVPKFFKLDHSDPKMYVYKYLDYRPWDKDNDMKQYERNGIIKTLTKHKIAPLVRCSSSHSVMTNPSNLRLGAVNMDFQNSLDTPIEGDEETSAEDPWMDSVSDTTSKKKLTSETSPSRKTSLTQHIRSQNRAMTSCSTSRQQPMGGVDCIANEVSENAANVTRQLTEMIRENSKLLRNLQHELYLCRRDRSRANYIMIFIITVAIAVIVQVLFYFSHQINAK